VYVRGNEILEWDQYMQRLAKRLEDLAIKERAPVVLLEREWTDQVGSNLGLGSDVSSVKDNLEFEERLREKHDLRREDFPLEVDNNPVEGAPETLVQWVIGL
jgi:hypothetical protein